MIFHFKCVKPCVTTGATQNIYRLYLPLSCKYRRQMFCDERGRKKKYIYNINTLVVSFSFIFTLPRNLGITVYSWKIDLIFSIIRWYFSLQLYTFDTHRHPLWTLYKAIKKHTHSKNFKVNFNFTNFQVPLFYKNYINIYIHLIKVYI